MHYYSPVYKNIILSYNYLVASATHFISLVGQELVWLLAGEFLSSFYEEADSVITSVINREAVEIARQAALQKGIKKGIEIGIEIALANFVLDCLEELSQIDSDLRERIIKEENHKILTTWGKFAARAGSVEEFVRQIEQ